MRNLSIVSCMKLSSELDRFLFSGQPTPESFPALSIKADIEEMMVEMGRRFQETESEDGAVPMHLAIYLRGYVKFFQELNDALLQHCDDYAVATRSLEVRYDNG